MPSALDHLCAQGHAGGHGGWRAACAASRGEGEAGTHVGAAAAAGRHGYQPRARLSPAGGPSLATMSRLRGPGFCNSRKSDYRAGSTATQQSVSVRKTVAIRLRWRNIAGADGRESAGVGCNAQPAVRLHRRTRPCRSLRWLRLPFHRCAIAAPQTIAELTALLLAWACKVCSSLLRAGLKRPHTSTSERAVLSSHCTLTCCPG